MLRFNAAGPDGLVDGKAPGQTPKLDDAHAVLVMDQAGWDTSGKLDVPANISILTLPSRPPELNPVENIWQFERDLEDFEALKVCVG